MLRKITEHDLKQLVAVDAAAQISPWAEHIFLQCLRVGSLAWGIEHDNQLIGFVLILVQSGEAHILNLCIHPAHQRQGLGNQLLSYALDHVKEQGAVLAFLEVRRSNRAAINLYKKMGFILIGERKDYYDRPPDQEDALVFAINFPLG